MRKYMYLISILILSSCQVADVQNGTEKKDNFLQEVGRLSDFVLSQSKVGDRKSTRLNSSHSSQSRMPSSA